MKLSQLVRMAATAPEVGDLRKIFPKRSFKGWKAVKSKPNHIWYEKDGFKFSVNSEDGFPTIFLKWPKSLGQKFIPSGRSWMPKQAGDYFTLSTWSDEDDWPEDQKLLQKISTLFIKS